MKDLVVIIQTRNRPTQASNTIKMLYDTCDSENNFDIFCIVDDDDIHNYDFLKKLYPKVKWLIVPHFENSWIHILQGQYEIILNNDYYFNWVITDDFHGLTKDWDKNIISNKNAFDDGLFALYTNSTLFNRSIEVFEKCYVASNFLDEKLHGLNNSINGNVIMYINEMLPICTKKWAEFMWDIFKNGNFSSSRELMISSLIYKLKYKYNINRHICANLSYDNVDSGPGTINTSNLIINDDGLNRDESFKKLYNDDFKYIETSLNKIYNHIQSYQYEK